MKVGSQSTWGLEHQVWIEPTFTGSSRGLNHWVISDITGITIEVFDHSIRMIRDSINSQEISQLRLIDLFNHSVFDSGLLNVIQYRLIYLDQAPISQCESFIHSEINVISLNVDNGSQSVNPFDMTQLISFTQYWWFWYQRYSIYRWRSMSYQNETKESI